jgi:hypothetical protein
MKMGIVGYWIWCESIQREGNLWCRLYKNTLSFVFGLGRNCMGCARVLETELYVIKVPASGTTGLASVSTRQHVVGNNSRNAD